MKQILIQGIEGSNHHMAVKEYFVGEAVQLIPCNSFKELFDKLISNADLLGMAAMENTLAGSLLSNYDLLHHSRLQIIGEHKMHISHHLMALPGQKMTDIKEVHSHPMALAQCEDFLQRHPFLQQITREDTALSARQISVQQSKGIAAIAGSKAAEMYDLEIIAPFIESNPHNFTRFLLIGSGLKHKVEAFDKSSIVFSLAHKVGSLADILQTIAIHQINLTKIQSLPIIGKAWEYLFYVDLAFEDHQSYYKALEAMRPLCNSLEILGEYQSFDSRKLSTTNTKTI